MSTLPDNTYTAFPYDSFAVETFAAVEDDSMGRVYVVPENPAAVTSDDWMTTTDLTTGLTIEMRRANCGGGCRCATEVRVAV